MKYNPCRISMNIKEQYGDEIIGLIQYPYYKMLGAFIVIMFETFEQQILSFNIKPNNVYNTNKYQLKHFKALKNIIKHGKGNAFDILEKMNTTFLIRKNGFYVNHTYNYVHHCNNGQEIILNYSVADIKTLCEIFIEFWVDYAELNSYALSFF
jgi:hypothetical protein